MKVYQITAKGSLSTLDGMYAIASKEVYTSPPTSIQKEVFKQKCTKCNGAKDLYSLDPNAPIEIGVLVLNLIDNGKILKRN